MSLRWNKYIAVIGAEVAIRLSDNPIAQTHKLALSSSSNSEECCATFDTLIATLPRSKLPMLDVIEIALGYPYVNHMILPWQDEIISPADRLAYAESMLEQHYGIIRSDWYCEISQEKFGCPAIASAIRRDIVDEIIVVCKKQKIRLQRIQTLLSDTINRHPGVLHTDAVFVVRQSESYEFAFRQDGIWRNAFTLPGVGQEPALCILSASILANFFPENVYSSDYTVTSELPVIVPTRAVTHSSQIEVIVSQESTHASI